MDVDNIKRGAPRRPHAPQEAERTLAESIDYSRQGQLALRGVTVPGLKIDELARPGVGTPAESQK